MSRGRNHPPLQVAATHMSVTDYIIKDPAVTECYSFTEWTAQCTALCQGVLARWLPQHGVEEGRPAGKAAESVSQSECAALIAYFPPAGLRTPCWPQEAMEGRTSQPPPRTPARETGTAWQRVLVSPCRT